MSHQDPFIEQLNKTHKEFMGTNKPKSVMAKSLIIHEILAERDRQDEKFNQVSHDPLVWGAILGEEVGEVSKAILNCRFRPSEKSKIELRRELIQVAAVAVAFLEDLHE